MQHEFRYAGETYDVLLERTPKIWTFANHCACLLYTSPSPRD